MVAGSLPGGATPRFNLGMTAVQQTGHWTGLFGTYEGGCDGPGDLVADTPPEAGPAAGCPGGRDSRPGVGPDPVHNYMDGGDDRCKNRFGSCSISHDW
ncbi:hypothetical protein ACFUIW_17045 [Streptomyces sp. NPDC057245]|uniref:hypothetical protein n=1 Tax=Streptomyces sp. NPDC057245 TaxID=3346065 RepID=UPI003644EAE3